MMAKTDKLGLICVALAVLIASYCQCDDTVNEITIKPIKICEFTAGDASNKQIPNIDEGADLYTAPRNLIVDNNGYIYILIVGDNRIIEVSSNGNIIKNYNLTNLEDIIAICLDRVNNYICALQENQIIIFNTNFVAVKSISYRKYLNKNIYFRKIRVYNGSIYVYESDYNDLFLINDDKKTIINENYFRINNNWTQKIANSPEFGTNKLIFFNINNIKREINISTTISYLEFANITNQYAYFYAYIYIAGQYITEIFVFNEELQTRLIQISEDDDIIWGKILPLIDIDSRGNIFQLCLQNNKFLLYKYNLQDVRLF